MSFKKITENVSNITLLADQPSLSANLLKKEFDKGNETLKTAFNNQVEGLNEFVENIASEYNNTLTYKVGDYCMYENKLYKCITEITTAESFDESKWEDVNIVDELNKNKTITLNGDTLISQSSPGGGIRLMLPINNLNNNAPTLNITSAEMYSSSQGWKAVTNVTVAAYNKTYCVLLLAPAPFTVEYGYNYLTRLTGTITTH